MTRPPGGISDVEPTHGVDLRRTENRRTHTQDTEIFCVAARAPPCDPRRRLSAPAGPKRSPGAGRPRASGGRAVGPRDVGAGLSSRWRSGRGRADRDGPALAAGTGRPRGRAAAGLTLVGHRSLKAARDLDGGEPSARARALGLVLEEVARWQHGLKQQHTLAVQAPPMQEVMETITQMITQDTAPDPEGGPA